MSDDQSQLPSRHTGTDWLFVNAPGIAHVARQDAGYPYAGNL
ncbi:hypothetical protein ACKF11_05720 [Methylobacillus sp. Pita2]